MFLIVIFLWCTYWYILPAIGKVIIKKSPDSKFWNKVADINYHLEFGLPFDKYTAVTILYLLIVASIATASLVADCNIVDENDLINKTEYAIEHDYVTCDIPSDILCIVRNDSNTFSADLAKNTLSIGYVFFNDTHTKVRNYDYEDLFQRATKHCKCTQ